MSISAKEDSIDLPMRRSLKAWNLKELSCSKEIYQRMVKDEDARINPKTPGVETLRETEHGNDVLTVSRGKPLNLI